MRIGRRLKREHAIDMGPDHATFAQVYQVIDPPPEDPGRRAEMASDEAS